MITAIAASGAGVKGIIELAYAKAIIDSGYPIDYAIGTSSGALTVAFMCAGQVDVGLEWMRRVTDHEVYRPAPLKLLGKEASLLDNEPLKNNIARLLDTEKLRASKIPCIVNITDMTTWSIVSVDLRTQKPKDIVDLILASASVPMLFPCRDNFVDGGTIDDYAVFDAITTKAKRVILFQCSSKDPKPIHSIIGMASQVLELTLYNQFLMTTRALALFKPDVELVVIENPIQLGIGLLDFDGLGSIDKRDELIGQSYEVALNVISKLKQGIPVRMKPR